MTAPTDRPDVGALSPEKQALLARLLARKAAERAAGGGAPAGRIAAREPGPAPLSYAQELLWLYEQMTPGTSAYNVPMARRVRGPFDVGTFASALGTVVARHEALRTSFVQVDGAPRQVADAPRDVPVDVHDLRGASHEVAARDVTARDAEADRLLRAAAAEPFDLALGTWPRAVVVRLADDESLVLVVMHHIVFDGASAGIFWRELASAYAGDPLGALPIQLADYAAWERRDVDAGGDAPALAFWREYLDGAPTAIDLPTDRPRTSARWGPAGRATATYAVALRDDVRSLARVRGATTFHVLVSAFETLLHRYSGQSDLVVGSPVAGRSRAETEPLIGYLASTVVLRARFDDDPTFATLLARTTADAGRALEHQRVPTERLARELRGGRVDAAGAPFDVLFVLQDGSARTPSLGTATLEPMGVELGAAKFDLTLSMTETDAGLRVAAEYRRDLFDAATIDGMLRHFGALLAAAVAAPDVRVSALPLLPPDERASLLAAWQGPRLAYDTAATMASLFEAQAARTPNAPALACGDAVLSYAELEARSGALALALRALGIGPDVRVGVCLRRTPELVVALLAVLRAGGAYVPLDPAYPEERLQVILADAGAPVLLTERALVAELPLVRALAERAGSGPRVLVLDAPDGGVPNADAPDAQSPASALVPPAPSDLAYVIYTSGSTGRPKGVAIEHRNAAAFIAWARTVFTDAELAGVVGSTSVCFDLSVFELFVTLSLGGTVVLVENALALPELVSPVPPTLLNTVPSAIAALLRVGGVPASVRTVNLAGEPLAQETVDALYALGHVERVFDLYGPSEDTTYSTYVRRTPGGRASIGRAIANTEAYVLDRAMQPVPTGVPGELYLGGHGLARGYLGRPDLTAERFVANPFAAECGLPNDDRLYRTSDRVRWTRDGVLEYLGRLDFMVKLRGFRIELGEIESVLRAQPGIGGAVAMVREAPNGEPRLVAYVAARPDAPAPARPVLLAALRARLPEYMVPSAIVTLDALPLTPNGKVDRAALPVPDDDAAGAIEPPVAPRDDLETVIAGVWADVLARESVGVESSFFDLGGHSLLATRIVGQIGKIFRVTLPLRRFFEAPTVAGVARALVSIESKPGQTQAIARLYLKVQRLSPEERERLRRDRASMPNTTGPT